MVVKLVSKQLPFGLQPCQFRYAGRCAVDQGDFGPEVGVADLAPINEQGAINTSRYFHMGVVEARRSGQVEWFVYMEWGKVGQGHSWTNDAARSGLDFMFVRCRDEAEARRFFRHRCMSMNLARMQKRDAGVWVAKTNAQGQAEAAYRVGAPSTHARGLPQLDRGASLEHVEVEQVEPELGVLRIVDSRPESDARTNALVRGILHDARVAALAKGVVPTLEVIEQISDELLPLVVRRIVELSTPEGTHSLLGRVAAGTGRPRPNWSNAS